MNDSFSHFPSRVGTADDSDDRSYPTRWDSAIFLERLKLEVVLVGASSLPRSASYGRGQTFPAFPHVFPLA